MHTVEGLSVKTVCLDAMYFKTMDTHCWVCQFDLDDNWYIVEIYHPHLSMPNSIANGPFLDVEDAIMVLKLSCGEPYS